jgi:hypothetical protein
MQITKTNATENKTTSEIDLFSDVAIPKDLKREVAQEVGELLVEKVLGVLSEGKKSPVDGEQWPKLTTNYLHKKEAAGLPGKPNMEFTGEMLDSLSFKVTKEGIEFGIFGKDAPKADGHNNFSGRSQLPQRRFLPAEGQEFMKSIQEDVQKIIDDAVVGAQNIQDELDGVKNRQEFWGVLNDLFPELSRSAIKEAVMRSPSLVAWLEEEEMLEWL